MFHFKNGDLINNYTRYYFRIEPIQWKIIKKDSDRFFVTSYCILDNQPYHDSFTKEAHEDGTYDNNYKNSQIRHWLNDYFYSTAFEDNTKISKTFVDNMTGDKYACENTYDNIFLLSKNEINENNINKCSSTDYVRAKINGAPYDEDYFNGYALYITRTPCRGPYYPDIYFVTSRGSLTHLIITPDYAYRWGLTLTSSVGIRPTLNFALNNF